MIARTWHGVVPAEKGAMFREHLRKTGIAEAEATPGNLGAFFHSQTQNGFAHFFMISYWTDMEAVKAFAGPSPQIAVSYPGDEASGLISDPIVLHFEVTNVPDQFPLTREAR